VTAEKIRENRLRRMADRQGLRLVKSRRRDPRAIGYGTYTLIDLTDNTTVGDGMTIDDVERALTTE
jgi:hypothetical protein